VKDKQRQQNDQNAEMFGTHLVMANALEDLNGKMAVLPSFQDVASIITEFQQQFHEEELDKYTKGVSMEQELWNLSVRGRLAKSATT
jgi:hypothetical protein